MDQFMMLYQMKYGNLIGRMMPDSTTNAMIYYVYSTIPIDSPVTVHAPLSSAADVWAAGSDADDGVDHFSRLPLEILRCIVGRLPAKDAARTSALSSRWRRVWLLVPLALADAHLLSDKLITGDFSRPIDWRALTSAVSRALAAHPGPVRSLHLACTYMDKHPGEVALWLQLLAAKDVKELVFINRVRSLKTEVRLPTTLFRCTALTRLYLGFWHFPDTTAAATLPRGAGFFPHLRELGLCCTGIEDKDLAFLVEKCPVLENLMIVANRGVVRLRVVSDSMRCLEVCASMVEEIAVVDAESLERLLLWEAWGVGTPIEGRGFVNMCSRIKIGHAPKLRVLGFLLPGMHELEIGGTIIKAGTRASPSTVVLTVEIFAISVNFGDRKDVKMLPSFLRCFPNVKTLYVQSENDKIRMPTGKVDPKFWQEAGSIECVQHHIKKVVFREFQQQTSELEFLKFIAKRAMVLEKMVILFPHECSSSFDLAAAKVRAFMASVKWANEGCKLMVVQNPYRVDGTGWCFQAGFDFTNPDPLATESRFRGLPF